jgi:hypothetical protein
MPSVWCWRGCAPQESEGEDAEASRVTLAQVPLLPLL